MITTHGPDTDTSNILIAVDSSPAAAAAINWASELVAHKHDVGHDARALLVTVIRSPIRMEIEGLGAPDNRVDADRASDLLEVLGESFPSDTHVTKLIRSGGIAETILEEASAQSSELIVVGTRHKGAIRQALMGSVSQRLASERDRPVAVVPAEYSSLSGRSVVGYDGSAGSRAALRWALENCEGDVRVVRVVPTAEDVVEARESIAALVPALGSTAAGRVVGEVVVGEVIDVLTSDDLKPPQIVVGARSDREGKDHIWGSTTTRLLADTTQPIVVVPPEPWDG